MPLHGEHVCAECFEDEDICAFVREHLEFDECSYCGKTSDDGASIAANVEEVIDFIEGKLSAEYEDPVEQVGWCSAEGGWLGVNVNVAGKFGCSAQDEFVQGFVILPS